MPTSIVGALVSRREQIGRDVGAHPVLEEQNHNKCHGSDDGDKHQRVQQGAPQLLTVAIPSLDNTHTCESL